MLRVKICGIARSDQAEAIARLGASALGFICVPSSPRYVTPAQIQAIAAELTVKVDRIGVFVDAKCQEIASVAAIAPLTGIQLHGSESPDYCGQLRQLLPNMEIIKALRIATSADLDLAASYINSIDTLLLDAYHPQLHGGTGKTLNWQTLERFCPPVPWLLAGGLTPDNVLTALSQAHPDGIDLSSGVEKAPGDKDIGKVQELLAKLQKR